MTLHTNVFGDQYDESEPCFLTTEEGTLVWDRVRSRWLDLAGLVAKAAADDHQFGPREVGPPSIVWQRNNPMILGAGWASDAVSGPHMSDETQFWINKTTGMVSFDTDIWMTGEEVCLSDIEDSAKLVISAQLVADECRKLPCTLAHGAGMTSAYLKAQKTDDE